MSRKPKGEGGFVKNNIKNLREKAGISQGDLADKVGLSKSYLSRLEASKRRFSLDIADKIAQGLGVTRSSIVDIPTTGVMSVTVKGSVQAGAWLPSLDWPQEDFFELAIVDNGLYPGVARHAAEVVGPSMNKIFPEGSILFWVKLTDIKEPLMPGRRYILNRHTKDGMVEHTVKTYMRDQQGKDWFYPESTDPKYQAAISLEDSDDNVDRVEIVGRVIASIRDE